MKAFKIVIFIFAILIALGVLCYFFPKNGIKIGPFDFSFATLESVLTNKEEAPKLAEIDTVKPMEEMLKDSLLKAKQDTIDRYLEIMHNHISRIYTPNDNPNYFNDFFAKAEKAQANGRTIRVLHYGDSQIELDRMSSDLRQFFQGKFGGGGPGLLPIVQNVPCATVTQSSSNNFQTYSVFGPGSRDKEHKYGIMTKYWRVQGSGSCHISRTRGNKIRLLLNDRSGNFEATLKSDDFEETKSCDSIGGFHILQWNLPSSFSNFSVTFKGSADLYGLMVDNGSGIAVDNIALRGCSGTIFTSISSSLLQQSYRQTDVGMIVLQFGGNSMPAIGNEQGIENYKNSIIKQIKYLQSIYPDTPILFIGPSDMSKMVNGSMQSYPLMEAMVEAMKEAALENGAAFWNIYEVMGGHNSMLAWVHEGLAGQDYVHFSPAGARKIGSHLVDAFSTIYDYYCVSQDKE